MVICRANVEKAMKITIRQEQVTTRGWQGWRSSTPGPLEAGMASSNLDFKDAQLSSLGGRSPTKCSTTGSPNSFNTTASRAMFAPFALAIGHSLSSALLGDNSSARTCAVP